MIGNGVLAVEALQHREGFHEHADAPGDFRSASAVDGSEKRFFRACKAAQRIAEHAGEKRAGFDVQFFHQRRQFAAVQFQGPFQVSVLLLPALVVVNRGGADFRIGKQRVVPLLRFGKAVCFARLPLLQRYVCGGHGFARQRFPGIGPVQFV